MTANTFGAAATDSVAAPDEAALEILARIGTPLHESARSNVPTGIPSVNCATWTCL